MFKAMKRVWLGLGAVMMMLSGLSGFLAMEAKAAGSYDEATCKKYYEGKRIPNDLNGYKCSDIKDLYSKLLEVRANKLEDEARIINSTITKYENVVEMYKNYEKKVFTSDKDVETCKTLYNKADFKNKFGIMPTRDPCDLGIKSCLHGGISEWQPRAKGDVTKVPCKDILNDFAPTMPHEFSSNGRIIHAESEGEESGEIDNYSLCLDKTGVLGWIICPVLTAMRSAIEWAYEQIEDFFAINPSFLKTEGKDSVYGAWKGFRDFGNIIFAILIMVIIFSQLTGIGISNYGIKKLLPKIIVVAILVNISYYLAQLAVDISNIIGYSAKSFLVSQVELSGSVVASDRGLGSAVVGVVMGAIIGVGLALIFLSIPLLGAALLASLTMLAMLGLRQGLAITLVVMSPLALACFLLPNTKKIFDKYWAATKAVLIAFPLSGIMIGAGQVAGALTINASNGSEIMVIMGFLMYFAPFFAVPTMLKKSLDAIGGLGSKISGFGFGKAKKQLKKAGEISKDRRKRVGAWAWTKKDANGNVQLRRGAAAFSRMAGSNIATKMLFGRAAINANKGAAAVNAKAANDDKQLNEDFVNKEMTKANLEVRASLDENVIRDQLQGIERDSEITINRARMRQENQEVYTQERLEAEEKLRTDAHRIQQIARMEQERDHEGNIIKGGLRGSERYFSVRAQENRHAIEEDIANKIVAGNSDWIAQNRTNKARLKAQNESTSAAVEMISAGNFEFQGEVYNSGDVPALERLARRTATIVGADGQIIQNGNSAVFKAVIQTLANRGKNGDFEAIERIITGQERTKGADGEYQNVSYLGAGNTLSGDTMMAYSGVIASNKDNKSKFKAIFDQAMAIESSGKYDAEAHNLSNFLGADLDKYDAYSLGDQKIVSLEHIISRVNDLKSATDEKSKKEIMQLHQAILQAQSNERISGKWDGDQKEKMRELLTAVESTEIGRRINNAANTQRTSSLIDPSTGRPFQMNNTNSTAQDRTASRNVDSEHEIDIEH